MTMLLTESHGDDDLRHKSLILFPSEATKPYWCIRLMFFIQILKNPKLYLKLLFPHLQNYYYVSLQDFILTTKESHQ